MSKYTIPSGEGQIDGVGGPVPDNLLSLTNLAELEKRETLALQHTYEHAVDTYASTHQFTMNDLRHLHKFWLKDIYSWAGQLRSVNMSKGGFTFAAAHLLPGLMQKFEREVLFKYTPTNYAILEETAYALAIVHVEFILIHPFREGNGRLGRLLATLMAMQAGYPPLDFSLTIQQDNPKYISAIHKGLECDYKPMSQIFIDTLQAG